jgi:DNA-binding response OmpR family regulator
MAERTTLCLQWGRKALESFAPLTKTALGRAERRALMRDAPGFDGLRPLQEAASLVRFASLVLSLDAYMLARDSGGAILLTRGEFALLRMFVGRPGLVISRDTLLDAFTNRRFGPFERSVDVFGRKVAEKRSRPIPSRLV